MPNTGPEVRFSRSVTMLGTCHGCLPLECCPQGAVGDTGHARIRRGEDCEHFNICCVRTRVCVSRIRGDALSLASFTKLFSDQYAESIIRMNNVVPGFIDSLSKKVNFVRRIPIGRYGIAEEIASTVACLVSDDAQYIIGQNLRGNGLLCGRFKRANR